MWLGVCVCEQVSVYKCNADSAVHLKSPFPLCDIEIKSTIVKKGNGIWIRINRIISELKLYSLEWDIRYVQNGIILLDNPFHCLKNKLPTMAV